MEWERVHRLIVLRELGGGGVRRPVEGWTPDVDVVETDAAFIVVAELPGLRHGEFDLQVTPYGLTLQGARRAPCAPCDAYVQLERPSGEFQRRFTFPVPVLVEQVTARFELGVLTVTVPKGDMDPRRIEVS